MASVINKFALALLFILLPLHQAFAINICGSAPRITCVVDGDTLWLQGEKIRILDLDAPEVTNPECRNERALGLAAGELLRDLLNHGQISLARDGVDRYDRTLAQVFVDGRNVAQDLINAGLAQPYADRHRGWC